MTRLHTTLWALADRVAHDPEPARALLSERLATELHRGASLGDMDVRLEVPLADIFMPAVAELDLDGAQSIEIVTMLVNFVLCTALSRPSGAREVADLAMRLLPGSAGTGTRRGAPWAPQVPRRRASDRLG